MLEKIILGTVQFGLDYGINNAAGKTSVSEVKNILNEAYKSGIDKLDTSDLYGDAQKVLAPNLKNKNWKVGSKFSLENGINLTSIIEKTLHELEVPSIEIYSFHRTHDFLQFRRDPSFLREIEKLRTTGLVKKLGVSLYNNEELEIAINTDWIDVIQLPINVFDHLGMKKGLLELAKRKNKTIHARSIFLQGLFFKTPDSLQGNLKKIESDLTWLKALSHQYQLGVQELAVRYVLSLDYVDGIVVGVDNLAQLASNLIEFKRPKLSTEILSDIHAHKFSDESLLLPMNWRLS